MNCAGKQEGIVSFLRRETYMNAHMKPGAWPSSVAVRSSYIVFELTQRGFEKVSETKSTDCAT